MIIRKIMYHQQVSLHFLSFSWYVKNSRSSDLSWILLTTYHLGVFSLGGTIAENPVYMFPPVEKFFSILNRVGKIAQQKESLLKQNVWLRDGKKTEKNFKLVLVTTPLEEKEKTSYWIVLRWRSWPHWREWINRQGWN